MGRRLDSSVRQHFKPTLEQNIRMGEALTVGEIIDANLNRSTIYHNMLEMFDTFDVLGLPDSRLHATPTS